MPEQNIEFDPRLIRPHAAILTEPITEKDSQLYWQFIVFRNEFYRKHFLPRERSTWLKKKIKKVVLNPTGSVLVQNSVRQSKILRLIPVWCEAQTIKFTCSRKERVWMFYYFFIYTISIFA